jgi:hypothetical protein
LSGKEKKVMTDEQHRSASVLSSSEDEVDEVVEVVAPKATDAKAPKEVKDERLRRQVTVRLEDDEERRAEREWWPPFASRGWQQKPRREGGEWSTEGQC